MKFSWKNQTKTSLFSKNYFFKPEKKTERTNIPSGFISTSSEKLENRQKNNLEKFAIRGNFKIPEANNEKTVNFQQKPTISPKNIKEKVSEQQNIFILPERNEEKFAFPRETIGLKEKVQDRPNFSKNIFNLPKKDEEKKSFPKIYSSNGMDFVKLNANSPKIPRFYRGGSIEVKKPTLFMAGESESAKSGSPERISIQKSSNEMVSATNRLTISQDKFWQNNTFKRDCPPSPTPTVGTNGQGGDGGQSPMQVSSQCKFFSTFDKVSLENMFLPIWRSFNA